MALKIKELNHQNSLLNAKYNHDEKYFRIHKRLLEQNLFLSNERKIFETLNNIKNHTDELVLQNDKILKNEEYFNQEVNRNVATEFTNLSVEFNSNEVKFISNLVVKEYLNEYNL